VLIMRQRGVCLQGGVSRHPDLFPKQFFGHVAVPPLISPGVSSAGGLLYPAGKGSHSIHPKHRIKQPPSQMALRQEQPTITGMFHPKIQKLRSNRKCGF
jgi:hypothetical protein